MAMAVTVFEQCTHACAAAVNPCAIKHRADEPPMTQAAAILGRQ